MVKRIQAMVLTFLGFIIVFRLLSLLINKFFGEETEYKGLVNTLGAILLSPRFNYNKDRKKGEKRLEVSFPLVDEHKTIYVYDKKKATVESDNAQ